MGVVVNKLFPIVVLCKNCRVYYDVTRLARNKILIARYVQIYISKP